jgi:hypothetical protein
MKIINIEYSPRQNKRYRIYLDNGAFYDFGLLGGSTFLDHNSKQKREAYRARHIGNEKEEYLINNLIPSPALFSYWLLWGDSIDLDQNIKNLNKMFKKKYIL